MGKRDEAKLHRRDLHMWLDFVYRSTVLHQRIDYIDRWLDLYNNLEEETIYRYRITFQKDHLFQYGDLFGQWTKISEEGIFNIWERDGNILVEVQDVIVLGLDPAEDAFQRAKKWIKNQTAALKSRLQVVHPEDL